MKIIFRTILLLLIITSSIVSQENNYFHTYKPSDGLSNNIVLSLAQDLDGYLWFGTADGLNRFDGYEFKIFRNDPADSTTLPSNSVNSIEIDKYGALWVGTVDNVSRLNADGNSFTTIGIDKSDNTTLPSPINSILFDSKGRMFVGTGIHDVQVLEPGEKSFTKIPFDSKLDLRGYHWIFDIEELSNGNIIIADYLNGPLLYHSSSNIFRSFLEGSSIIPNEINTLHEDAKGNIWFGGDDFLIKYLPTVNEFEKISYLGDSIQKDRISDIIEDNDGFIIVRSDSKGIVKIDPVSNTVLDYKQGNVTRSFQIIQDKNGIFWTGLAGGIEKYDPDKIEFTHLPFKSVEESNASQQLILTILPDNSNQNLLWLGTSNKGLYKYFIEEKKFEEITLDPRFNFPTKSIRALTQDKKDNIWFYIAQDTLSLLYKYNPSLQKFSNYNPNVRRLSVYRDISKIKFIDKNELMVGGGFGLRLFNIENNRVKNIPTIMRRRFTAPLWDKIQEIAFNTETVAKLSKMGEQVNETRVFSVDKTSKFLVICQGEGEILGHSMYDYGSIRDSKGSILWTMDEVRNTFNAGGGSKNRINIKCLELQPGDYNINYRTDQGHSFGYWNVVPPEFPDWYGIRVYEIDDNDYNFFNEKIEENNLKQALTIDAVESFEISKKDPDVVWIGSRGNGLVRFNMRDSSSTQYYFEDEKWGAEVVTTSSLANFITRIYEDRNGIVWVINRTGLIRLDAEKNKWEKIDEKYGLTGKTLVGLTEDFLGNLWITTPNEVFSFNKNDPKDKWILLKFNTKDGISESLITSDITTQKDGRIIFAGKTGIQTFYPKPSNKTEPDIIISDVFISEKSLNNYSITLGNSNQKFGKTLELNYNQNDLSFEFASVHFANPGRNRISYKMDGVQDDWIYTQRRYASFPNLDPGEYTFRVKGANGDGVWNETGKFIDIKINPPFWRSTFAYIFYGLLLIAGVFTVDRIQRKRLSAKAKEKMKIQDAEHRAEAAELQSRAIQAENDRKTKELEEARQLQLSMLPKDLPNLPHLDIAVYMKTATEVGGDYYDFHIGLDGTLTVVLGDATGHGMKAGTMVTSTKSLFNTLAPNPNIVETFHEMTRCLKLMQMEKLSMCLTMLKIIGTKIQMSSAGMPPVLIYKRENQSLEEHVMKGMPLGTFNEFPYTLIESNISSGDTILIMSDGFPELFNEHKEMFGYKRAKNLFEEIAGESPEEIISKLKYAGSDFINDKEPDDDVTFVVIKVK